MRGWAAQSREGEEIEGRQLPFSPPSASATARGLPPGCSTGQASVAWPAPASAGPSIPAAAAARPAPWQAAGLPAAGGGPVGGAADGWMRVERLREAALRRRERLGHAVAATRRESKVFTNSSTQVQSQRWGKEAVSPNKSRSQEKKERKRPVGRLKRNTRTSNHASAVGGQGSRSVRLCLCLAQESKVRNRENTPNEREEPHATRARRIRVKMKMARRALVSTGHCVSHLNNAPTATSTQRGPPKRK